MKKQHKTYLLLSIVLIVWGLIGYRIVKTVNPPAPSPMELAVSETFVPKQIRDRESFTIVADYRDPFLGTMKKPVKVKKQSVTSVKKNDTPKRNIIYTGFVSGKAIEQNIFFVTIDGNQQMMSLNDTFADVKLVKGTKNYIKVSYQGISQKISLNQ